MNKPSSFVTRLTDRFADLGIQPSTSLVALTEYTSGLSCTTINRDLRPKSTKLL